MLIAWYLFNGGGARNRATFWGCVNEFSTFFGMSSPTSKQTAKLGSGAEKAAQGVVSCANRSELAENLSVACRPLAHAISFVSTVNSSRY